MVEVGSVLGVNLLFLNAAHRILSHYGWVWLNASYAHYEALTNC